ncbi:aldehyde dehydrogenase family protein [Mycolicibacterium peregrinum]
MTHVSLESTSPAPTSVVQPGQFRDILNPATGEVIATLPEHGEREVDAAVSAARRAFEVGVVAEYGPQRPRQTPAAHRRCHRELQ